jgi:hypothetical protein
VVTVYIYQRSGDPDPNDTGTFGRCDQAGAPQNGRFRRSVRRGAHELCQLTCDSAWQSKSKHPICHGRSHVTHNRPSTICQQLSKGKRY